MKFREPTTLKEYEQTFSTKVAEPNTIQHGINNCWYKSKKALLEAADNTCGWIKEGFRRQCETWWWDDTVAKAIKQKRKLWKEWQKVGNKEAYFKCKTTC